MSEEEFNILMKLVDAGDNSSLEKIYDFYALKIKRIAFAILGDIHYAEDVLQKVLIILWNKSKRFLNVHSPDSLIYRLAKNAAIDIYRQNKKRAKKYVSLDKMQEEKNFEVPIDNDFSKFEFLSIISSLDEKEKDIVYMKAFLGYTHREIAEYLKMPEGKIKWKYQVTFKKIKEKNKFT